MPRRDVVRQNHGKAITRAVREFELVVFKMAPEDTVPAQFVESHPPVGRDPDRIFDVDLRRREGTGSAAFVAKFYKRPQP